MNDPTSIKYYCPSEPSPILDPDQTLGAILAFCLRPEPQTKEEWAAENATDIAIYEIAQQLAPVLGVRPNEIVETLRYLPVNMDVLLDIPQGWTVISGFVAQMLGFSFPPDFLPTTH